MVAVLGVPELSRLWEEDGLAVMVKYPELINTHLAAWAATRDSRAAMREAQAAGWPVVVVNDPYLLLEDEHLGARGFWVRAPHPVVGELPYTGPPWRLGGGGWALRRTAPLLGQHTDEVLRDALGLDAATIDELRASGAVA